MVKQAQRLLRKDLQACPGTAVKTRYNNNDDDSNDVKHDFFLACLTLQLRALHLETAKCDLPTIKRASRLLN